MKGEIEMTINENGLSDFRQNRSRPPERAEPFPGHKLKMAVPTLDKTGAGHFPKNP
jgi:hypothetical protein